MLRWLSIALVLAASHAAFADTSIESKSLHQCQAHAWVRAPDMVPSDVIAGDVKVKLVGPCTNVESYVLGLRYKERILWKLRRHDAPLPEAPEFKDIPMNLNRDLFQLYAHGWNPQYNVTEWTTYKKSFENRDLWTVHEEERVAFETKTTLVSAEGTDSLPSIFITQFGILVPNTNYPPGLDYRVRMMMDSMTETDVISSESIYEYFVEIKFSNGTTSEIPAGITAFAPSYHLTESRAPPVNLSLTRKRMCPKPDLAPVDMLQSNYTIELSFPDGPQVYQNSWLNLMAVVHRTGYTNRTDIPIKLCAFAGNPSPIAWRAQGLKDRIPSSTQFVRALVPLKQFSSKNPGFPQQNSHPCEKIDFTIPVDLTGEGHISPTSSEPISLSLYVGHRVVPDFLTYYQELKNHVMLDLEIKPDPLEPKDSCQRRRMPRNHENPDMDESDYDWVPWPPMPMQPTYMMPAPHEAPVIYQGNTSISVAPMQKQGLLQSPPVHYLSEGARQPTLVAPADIADLRRMSPEERDLIAPLAQPYTMVFAKGEELRSRYSAHGSGNMQQVIYVGDTWVNKVVAKGQREMDNLDHLLVVQT